MMTLTLCEIAKAVGGTLNRNGDSVACGISTDSRTVKENEVFVALRGAKFDGHDFIPALKGKCCAVLSEKPVSDQPCILVRDTLKALGLLAAYWKRRVAPQVTVGVTGSVGKTTTKELIASVLKEKYKTHFTSGNLNNHIGVPITLIRIESGCEAVVCEMGMSGRGEIAYLTGLVRPNLAVITNIGTSHMELLGSREEILRAKLEILEGMEKGSTIILDGDEPLLRSETVRELTKDYRVLYVGFHTENHIYPMDIYKGKGDISFDVVADEAEFRVTVPAVGDHFVKDALFAVAVGLLLGVSPEGIAAGLMSYSPAGLRQRIYRKDEFCVIADCYNASPESMKASLKVLADFKGRKLAVLGDMLELGSISQKAHTEVGKWVYENGIDLLFCGGKNAKWIAEGALLAGMPEERIVFSENQKDLAESIKKSLRAEDHVLFKASNSMRFEELIALCDLTEYEN
ncbi:MAG: UDP-N-acetylmuramoyl-tripeptide--D-alanyl-D-alanine ligase [Clostridia bacterium]|nr:UDP-N-acetylmuramoyl-tripeptide--D-alanyl-D-alanine ligase [Clostridia bacterium]